RSRWWPERPGAAEDHQPYGWGQHNTSPWASSSTSQGRPPDRRTRVCRASAEAVPRPFFSLQFPADLARPVGRAAREGAAVNIVERGVYRLRLASAFFMLLGLLSLEGFNAQGLRAVPLSSFCCSATSQACSDTALGKDIGPCGQA
ncbi:unnamed protein product, partial [Prorocentrum cordatum]